MTTVAHTHDNAFCSGETRFCGGFFDVFGSGSSHQASPETVDTQVSDLVTQRVVAVGLHLSNGGVYQLDPTPTMTPALAAQDTAEYRIVIGPTAPSKTVINVLQYVNQPTFVPTTSQVFNSTVALPVAPTGANINGPINTITVSNMSRYPAYLAVVPPVGGPAMTLPLVFRGIASSIGVRCGESVTVLYNRLTKQFDTVISL